MPAQFWHNFGGVQKHLSLRLRFVARKKAEDFIKTKLNAARHLYWYSGFLDYDAVPGFAESRVFVGQNLMAKTERARLVADLLCSNSRFALDNLVQNNGQWEFEINPNGPIVPNHFWFPLHMMNNSCGLSNGMPYPLGFPIQSANPTCDVIPL
jgi:hypothetical protein